MKSPTGEEDPSGFKPDQQLGGGELLIHIGRHWEEEIAVSMIMFYQISPIDKWAIAQCSNAYNAWLRKFSAQKTLLLQIERRLIFGVRT